MEPPCDTPPIREQGTWTGEMAIPWRLLLNDSPNKPQLLRFNFIQHFQNTGESASWAGPIDFDQDDGFMGLLYLREFGSPGLHSSHKRGRDQSLLPD